MTRICPATHAHKVKAMSRQTGIVSAILGNLHHLKNYIEMADGFDEDAKRDLGHARKLMDEILKEAK